MSREGASGLGIEADTRADAQRQRWIREHSAFLSAALAEQRRVPRVPRRRVDQGGFTEFLHRPGVRALVDQWWARALELSTLDG